MDDWKPAGKVPELIAMVPAQKAPEVPAATLIAGQWTTDPSSQPIQEPGITGTITLQGQIIVYGADGSFSGYARGVIEGTNPALGFPMTFPISIESSGTYTAERLGPDRIMIKPKITITTTISVPGQPQLPNTAQVTAPYTLRLLDPNTMQDDEGVIYRRQSR